MPPNRDLARSNRRQDLEKTAFSYCGKRRFIRWIGIGLENHVQARDARSANELTKDVPLELQQSTAHFVHTHRVDKGQTRRALQQVRL